MRDAVVSALLVSGLLVEGDAGGMMEPVCQRDAAGLVRAVPWRGFDPPGQERRDFVRRADNWRLAGAVLTAWSGFRYEIDLDEDWHTRTTSIEMQHGTEPPRWLRLVPESDGRWWAERDGGHRREHVTFAHGLVDVDLGRRPATNTLPIRRLPMKVGATVECTAVRVRCPDLAVEPLAQRYTGLDECRYRYASEGEFVAALDVDALGLAVAYENLWVREGVATAGA